MAVEVVAGAVVAHGGSWVGVAGGDLYVAQVDAGVEHGSDEGVPEHERVRPRQLDPGVVGDWAGTWGRRAYSAGECSRTPSITHVR